MFLLNLVTASQELSIKFDTYLEENDYILPITLLVNAFSSIFIFKELKEGGETKDE
jgi:hypothetical protein